MTTKKKSSKKAGAKQSTRKSAARKKASGKRVARQKAEEPADPREPIEPTPAVMQRTLDELEKGLGLLEPPPEPHPADLVDAIVHHVFSEMLPCGVGQEVVRRVHESFVDRNELRVTEAYELAELLSDLGIPDLFQRCEQVNAIIQQVYNDQNAVSLDFLREATVADRNAFFQRLDAITPPVQRFLVNLLSFEEIAFSDRSTARVQQRIGLDPKSKAVEDFVARLRTLLAPFGHIPFAVGPAGRGVQREPVLSPGGVLLRLAPAAGKR